MTLLWQYLRTTWKDTAISFLILFESPGSREHIRYYCSDILCAETTCNEYICRRLRAMSIFNYSYHLPQYQWRQINTKSHKIQCDTFGSQSIKFCNLLFKTFHGRIEHCLFKNWPGYFWIREVALILSMIVFQLQRRTWIYSEMFQSGTYNLPNVLFVIFP